MQSEYDIRIKSITVEPTDEGDLFVSGWYDGGMGLIINQDMDFDKTMKRIAYNYRTGKMAGKTLDDYIAHEMFHIMAYQDCKTKATYRAKYMQTENLYEQLKGISRYADRKKSGNEALAEAFVRMRNKEKVSPLARVLVDTYVKKYKKGTWRR